MMFHTSVQAYNVLKQIALKNIEILKMICAVFDISEIQPKIIYNSIRDVLEAVKLEILNTDVI